MSLLELFANSCLWYSVQILVRSTLFLHTLFGIGAKRFGIHCHKGITDIQVNEAISMTVFLLPLASKKNTYLGFMLLRIVQGTCKNLAKPNMHVLDHQDSLDGLLLLNLPMTTERMLIQKNKCSFLSHST